MGASTTRLCPRLEAEPSVLQRLYAYSLASNIEVSGLGEVDATPLYWPETIVVPDSLYLPKQEGSGGHTELDTTALLSFTHELTTTGRSVARYRLWWHSHVEMSAFFSFTDESTIQRLAKTWPFVIAVVVNQHGESLWKFVRQTTELEVAVALPQPTPAILKDCQQKIEKQVTRKIESWLPWKKGGKSWGGKQDRDDWYQDWLNSHRP